MESQKFECCKSQDIAVKYEEKIHRNKEKHALQTQEESEEQVETRTANLYLLMQLCSHE